MDPAVYIFAIGFGAAVVAGLVVLLYLLFLRRRARPRPRAARPADAPPPVSEAREQDLYDRAPDMMASVDAATARLYTCNQTLADTLKCSKGWVLGTSIFDLYDPSCVQQARDAFQTLRQTGAIDNLELVLRPPDGRRIDVSLNATAVRDAGGRIVRARCVWHDISHYKRNEAQLREAIERQQELLQREKLLLRELNHRVRNNLAGILGLVRIFERSGKSPDEVSAAIRGKVRAMTEAHDMISHAHGQPVDLGAIVARLAADAPPPAAGTPADNGPSRIRWSGPGVPIPAAQVSALAMILQELMTNAQKHGALSVPEGAVEIRWSLPRPDDPTRLELGWAESGGPRVQPPPTQIRGIGLGLIEGLAGAELQGGCEFRFEPDGLRFSLHAHLTGSRWSDPVATPEPAHTPAPG